VRKITFSILLCLLLNLLSSTKAKASGVFSQTEKDTPKWSRLYAQFGRATGEYGISPQTFSVNYIGYKQMRGMFSYGGKFGYLYGHDDKLSTIEATLSLRPDWNLEAQPAIDVSYGTAQLTGAHAEKNGQGTMSSLGVSLDLIKGKAYSTSLGAAEMFLNSDSAIVKSTQFQSVTISLNFDIY
jgi:hypothetical protein